MRHFSNFGFPRLIYIDNVWGSPISELINSNFMDNSILAKYKIERIGNGTVPPPKYLSFKVFELNGNEIFTHKDPSSWMKLPWEFGSSIEYLKINTLCKDRPDFHPQKKNFEILLENLPNLKGICFVDKKSPQDFINFKDIFPPYHDFLKIHFVQNLTLFQFREKIKEYSKCRDFVFHFECDPVGLSL